jgi:hypothetical protein
MVDWSALLAVMSAASEAGRDPFAEAVRVQERLFTTRPIFLGVEHAMRHPDMPCGLKTDAERARHVRRKVREMRNSRGEWESLGALREVPLKEIRIYDLRSTNDTEVEDSEVRENRKSEIVNRSILTEPAALEKVGTGRLVVVGEEHGLPVYGRSITVADKIHDGRIVLAKWIRRLTNWKGRATNGELWDTHLAPLIGRKLAKQDLPVLKFEVREFRIFALVSLAGQTLKVPVDSHGVALWRPAEREVTPADCADCAQAGACRKLSPATGTALLWRRLGLVDEQGVPTLRGRVASFFQQGDGLAIAAALEEKGYPLDELLYDVANLDASFRFCGEENRWGGRLAMACQRAYGVQRIPGYLENGVPPKYGSGAEQVVAAVHKNPLLKHRWETEFLGAGDIDRVIIEWRSLLRQISHAPPLDWPRWTAFQKLAKATLNETESPTLTELPPLEHHQTRRVDHRLILRRH